MRRYASIEGEYRWWLERDWFERGVCEPGPISLMIFVMLNPSTADGEVDDPTIRRCISFAKREGATSLHVLNLYALRATNPRELAKHPDPVGIANDALLRDAAHHHGMHMTVVAWGANPMATPGRTAVIMDEVVKAQNEVYCLGMTAEGHPRHPLYVKGDQPFLTYPDGKVWTR